jgi:hypothetical protein
MSLRSFEDQVRRYLSALGALLILAAIFLVNPKPTNGVPAFARKYGLPCSACHISWPELNNFGQVFRDNGYQMMNDRDSPITHDPSYFPIAVRITPQWHRESSNNQIVDSIPGGGTGNTEITGTVTQAGFDLSGMDLWLIGTLYKNISFSVLPTTDPTATFHFENALVRFDNLLGSSWLNFKFGKYELDEPVSEKRLWTLSVEGGLYYIYHFKPFGDMNPWGGMGDNEIGIELMGHNSNSYTRYAFSVVSSLDGGVNLAYGENLAYPQGTFPPAGRTYDYYGHFEQAFNSVGDSYMKLGGYAYFGFAPTYWQTTGNGTTQLYGLGNKPFYRAGAEWLWFANKFNFQGVYMHAYDNAYLANGIPSNSGPLAPGLQAAVWNGWFAQFEYVISPQWVIQFRYDGVRMAQQASTAYHGSQSNLDAFTIASRWNPFMFSRAGLAFQQEYSVNRSNGVTDIGTIVTPSACPPISTTCNVVSQSLWFGFDFAF